MKYLAEIYFLLTPQSWITNKMPGARTAGFRNSTRKWHNSRIGRNSWCSVGTKPYPSRNTFTITGYGLQG